MEGNDSTPGPMVLDKTVFIHVKFKFADSRQLRRNYNFAIFAQSVQNYSMKKRPYLSAYFISETARRIKMTCISFENISAVRSDKIFSGTCLS
jgi:hypothetical protein